MALTPSTTTRIVADTYQELVDATYLPNGTFAFCKANNNSYVKKDGSWVSTTGGAGSPAWGSVTGTLADQTDLQTALDAKAPLASPTFTGTVAGVTKAMVGLGSADNTADSAKPVSTAQQTALDGKQPLDSDLTTIAGLTPTTDNFMLATASAWASRTPAQAKTSLALVKGDVGLGNVDNTSDASKPISTATQTALDGKASSLGADDNYVTDAEKVVIGNTSGANTGDSSTPAETATTIGSLISGATAKVTPVDADNVSITDSASSHILKKVTWANIKATLKTYFDTLYAGVLGSDDNYVTDAEKTKLSNLSGTNTGDNAVNSNYSGLVSNATHTGDATGATALSVVKIQGKDFPALVAGDDQKYPKYVSASNAFVMTAIAGGGDVTGDDTSTTAQNIVAYTGTGGKNITELTGTEGDMLYKNGSSWVKLAKGAFGQELKMNAGATAPEWSYGGVVHTSKSAGVTTTGANTTPVDVTGAVFSYVANATYRIWVMGMINSTAATTGGALHFNLSSAVTSILVFGGNLLASAGTSTAFASVADDATLGSGSSGVPAGPVDVPIIADALLITTVNTGTCQLRFRSETTAVTELLAGVVMVVERVM